MYLTSLLQLIISVTLATVEFCLEIPVAWYEHHLESLQTPLVNDNALFITQRFLDLNLDVTNNTYSVLLASWKILPKIQCGHKL
jgi:hypothetical protein